MGGNVHEIGYAGPGFCFDNELSRHRVWLEYYEIANRPITNGEFAEFIADGGYRDFRHWLAEGWDSVQRLGWEAPLYWMRPEADADWRRFALRGGLLSLDPAAPVSHVSFFEADAYARWAGARLPTEAEWEVACAHYNPTADTAAGTFIETDTLDPRALPAGADYKAAHQFLGDVWEWTYSAYHPYPGFRQAPGALGEYNGKFMINQLVLRGGSCATPRDHIRPTYRNFFPADKQWQFSGFRLARKAM
jgi:ergothioneine biosynthesis protein EgtB